MNQAFFLAFDRYPFPIRVLLDLNWELIELLDFGLFRALLFCVLGFCSMSRCFPFPPPGYEKKARSDDFDLLKKEDKEKKNKEKNRR
ncbi:hypothetical protein NC653_037785 [Populus alba x Populus x berolinensis]|uniref:Transmembrane protein n=1 Tax=Populus alba x Populus x berolinensis TaxID=444605 RepID=A0AAD6PTB3_9ROSI|nr:hypothetical protein NC653_037785 [Populus alba x Populus x berolinensis]